MLNIKQSPVKQLKQLRVKNVYKSFTKRGTTTEVLRDISFELQQGGFLSLLGPSGCGKSTLLKIIGGLQEMDRGRVEINGQESIKIRNKIGFMFQKSVLLPWRNVIENLLLPIELAGMNKEKAMEKARDLLKMVGLEDYEKYYPKELSGGMQQRVSLARVLMTDPDILLLDEPFGALDEFTRENLNFSLMEIARNTDKTVILVTHNINEAVLMSDQIIVLGTNPGRILEEITVSIPHPRTDRVMTMKEYTEYVWKIRELLGVVRK